MKVKKKPKILKDLSELGSVISFYEPNRKYASCVNPDKIQEFKDILTEIKSNDINGVKKQLINELAGGVSDNVIKFLEKYPNLSKPKFK